MASQSAPNTAVRKRLRAVKSPAGPASGAGSKPVSSAHVADGVAPGAGLVMAARGAALDGVKGAGHQAGEHDVAGGGGAADEDGCARAHGAVKFITRRPRRTLQADAQLRGAHIGDAQDDRRDE